MPGLWFVFEPERREQTAPMRRLWLARCREKAWTFAERSVRVVRDVEGRPLRLLSTRDLNELYRAAHRDIITIVDASRTRILLDPRDNARPSLRRTMLLERFAEYKALYFETGAAGPDFEDLAQEVDAHVEALSATMLPDTDPRALPFLPFDLGPHIDKDLELNSDHGRASFEVDFGSPRNRQDAKQISWKLDPRAYHGRDALLIRGRSLPAGCHWDVEGPRGGAHVMTATEVWHLKRGQYINVYPDMYVRTTRNGGRRIWPENK